MSVPTIRLSSPRDLLAAVPHLLSFQPTESLVLVTLHTASNATRLGMVARVDLPSAGQAAECVEALLPALYREAPSKAVLIGYGKGTADVYVAVEMAAELIAANGCPVMERITVVGDRWRSIDCTVPGCCPPEGQPLPGREAVVGLEFVVGVGSAPAVSREALAERVAPGARAAAVGRECERQARIEGEVTISRGTAAWGRLLDVSQPLDLSASADATLALAALSLHADNTPALRDALAAWLSPGVLPLESVAGPSLDGLREHLPLPWWQDGSDQEAEVAARHFLVDRLAELATSLPDDYAAPVLTLLAQVAWVQGSGAMANVALTRALTAQPDYRLALLLDRMVTLGVRAPTM